MTVIKSGSPAANKLFNVALFTQATRGNNFTNLLTDTAPQTVIKTNQIQQANCVGRAHCSCD